MEDLLQQIQEADSLQISTLLDAVLARYRSLFPNWSIHLISIDNSQDQHKQIDALIHFIESLKS